MRNISTSMSGPGNGINPGELLRSRANKFGWGLRNATEAINASVWKIVAKRETRFPQLVHVCEEAIQDTLRAATKLRLLADDGFVLAGDSSGGNIALSYVLASQRSGHAAPAALVLLYPVTDHAMDSASYIEFADDPNLSRQAMAWFWEQYIPEASLRADALASPLRAGVESFRAFPPTLIVTCEYDVLRDQGEALALELIQADVDVTAVRWLGALHGFLVTEDLLRGPAAQRCLDFVAQYCRRLNGAGRELA
jgi:acetyl esterase